MEIPHVYTDPKPITDYEDMAIQYCIDLFEGMTEAEAEKQIRNVQLLWLLGKAISEGE